MATLTGSAAVGTNGSDFEVAGKPIASKIAASVSGTIDTVTVRPATANTCTSLKVEVWSDSAGTPGTKIASSTTGTIAITAGSNAEFTSGTGINAAVTSGTTYWIVMLAPSGGNQFTFSTNTGTGGSGGTAAGMKDTTATGLAAIPATWGTTQGTYAETINWRGDSAGAAIVAPITSLEAPRGSRLRSAARRAKRAVSFLVTPQIYDTVTALADSDAATGTDAVSSLSVTAAGSESATGTDAGTVSATAASSDTSTGTDAASVSAVVPGSDAATGTDTGGSPSVSGTGGETGSGSDSGAVSATLTSSDSAAGTDAGVVADITGGATPVSGSDSGTATEAGSVSVIAAGTDAATATDSASLLDLTAPEPEPETGPTGGRYEPGGDESSIYGQPTESLRDTDIGVGVESAEVVDLTPRRTLELPLRLRPVRKFSSGDTATAQDEGALLVMQGAADSGQVVKESSFVEVIDDPVAAAEDAEVLMMLGFLSET